MASKIPWRKSLDGQVAVDVCGHTWRIRGPIYGKPMFWLYRDGDRVCERPGDYDSAVHFTSIRDAHHYVRKVVEAARKAAHLGQKGR